MDLLIKGKRALITGGSKGIGLGVARRLAAEGCAIVLVARSTDELAAASDRIRDEQACNVVTMSVDMSHRDAARKIVAAYPDVDIVVNNAGAIPTGSVERIDDQTWRDAWDVKVFGYIDMCRQYMPRMRQRRDGVIINIIGAAGETFDPDYIAGCAGNAALIAFTKALGASSINDGVRILGMNPGPVLTERLMASMRKRAADRLGDAERWREIAARMPGGRAAEVDEIAATVALLCSPVSAYSSGAVFNIDGGLASRHYVI
jgi:3-oxoacyl-[acyl-carrier protein] reductase